MLVLASKSPRRLALLRSAGINPAVAPADVDETPLEGELPIPYAVRIAVNKAQAIEAELVIAADTVVALDGLILAKPGDAAGARRMLGALSGRWHTVHTAVVARSTRTVIEVVSSAVRFRSLAAEEIDRYVATGEPMDKAGAYGIQGEGGSLVAEVRGSYTNVVGLPLEETLRLIALAR